MNPQLRAPLAVAPIIDANIRFRYSNHGFGLLGPVIEAIAGEAHGAWNKRIIGLMGRGHSGKLPGDRAGRQPHQRAGAGHGFCQNRPRWVAEQCQNTLAASPGALRRRKSVNFNSCQVGHENQEAGYRC
jgi:hypothetical protein